MGASGRWRSASTLIALTFGCHARTGSAPAAPQDAGAPDTGTPCPTGLQPAPDGQGCIDLSAPDPCPPGTGPFLGQSSCQPVGWTTACPAGMTPDPSGWGCIDVSPAQACADPTTMEALGQTTCVPIGDCTASFPPASATIFVNANYTPSQLDAAHYTSVFSAVQAAPPDATVAIYPGTYVEDVDIYTTVHIVGQCAAQVTVQNPGDDRSGMLINGAKGVTITGLTLTGHYSASYVENAGSVTISNSLLRANRWMGVYAVGAGSSATLDHVRIVGTVPPTDGVAAGMYGWGVGAQEGGAVTITSTAIVQNVSYGIALGGSGVKGTVMGSLVAWQQPSAGTYGEGIGVGGGAELSIEASAVVGNTTNAIHTQDMGSKATITQSVLRGTLLDGTKTNGGGLFVNGPSTAVITSSLIAETQWDGLTVAGAGAKATVTSSVIRGPLPFRAGTWGFGVNVAQGGELEIDGSAIVGTSSTALNVEDAPSRLTATGTLVEATVPVASTRSPGGDGIGVEALAGAKVTLSGCSVVGNTTAGLVSALPAKSPTDIQASATLIRGTRADLHQQYGFGALVQDGDTLELQGSAVVGTTSVGVAVTGATATLEGSAIRGVQMDASGTFGYGLVSVSSGVVTLGGSYVRENPGVGLAFSASTASVTSSWIADNAIGIAAQDGSTLVVANDAGTTPPTDEIVVSTDSEFTGNASRVGSGVVPLPAVPLTAGPRAATNP